MSSTKRLLPPPPPPLQLFFPSQKFGESIAKSTREQNIHREDRRIEAIFSVFGDGQQNNSSPCRNHEGTGGIDGQLGSNMVDKSAYALSVFVLVLEARMVLVEGITVLVKIIEMGSQRQKEITMMILLHISEENVGYHTMIAHERTIPPLPIEQTRSVQSLWL